jgi:hypothetical protein
MGKTLDPKNVLRIPIKVTVHLDRPKKDKGIVVWHSILRLCAEK